MKYIFIIFLLFITSLCFGWSSDKWGVDQWGAGKWGYNTESSITDGDALLLESRNYLLLESCDKLLLEV